MNEAHSNERRGLARLERRLPVRIELAGAEGGASDTHVGTITNFTEEGLRLESNALCPPGGDVTLFVQYEGRMAVLLARVVWWRMEPFALVEQMRFSCGMKLLYDVPQWRELVTHMRKESTARPQSADPRFEAVHRVRFSGDREFLSDYTQNISRGGMYLSTDRLLDKGAQIDVEIELPGVQTAVPLKATVVYRLDAAQARELCRAPGVGVKFVDFADPEREQFLHHIRRLEVHRSRAARIDLSELPKQGTLADYLVPELIISGAQKAFSGVIELEHRGIFKRIYMQQGIPIYVDSSLGSDRFGEYLVQALHIDDADLKRALAHAKSERKKLGEALVALSLMQQKAIDDALVKCHEHKLYNAFGWFDGSFAFVPLEEFPALVSPLRLAAEALVFEGARQCYDAEVVCAWTGMSRETQLICKNEPVSHASLPEDVARMLQACRNGASVEAIMQASDQRFETVIPLAYAMLLFGWIEAVRAESAPAQATVVPESRSLAQGALPELALEPELDELPDIDVETPAAVEPANDEQRESLEKAATFAARGEELLRKGDIIGAYKQYSLATAFAPTDTAYAARLAALTPLANEKRARELSDAAAAAAGNGDAISAAKQYEEASALMPEAARFAHLAAEMYLKGEQFEQALRMAEVAVTRSKDNPKYRVCLVEALRRSGNGKRAEDEMRAVMALAPKDPAVAAQAARLGMR